MKKYFGIIACVFCLTLWVGCEDDSDNTSDYTSVLPAFSDITFDTDQLYAGMTVTATAVQSKKGKLLNRTTYDWYVNDTTTQHVGIVYDQNNGDPIFTFKVPAVSITRPTSITIKFTGKYSVSGSSCKAAATEHAAGLTIVSEPSTIEGTVRLTKTVTVYPSEN